MSEISGVFSVVFTGQQLKKEFYFCNSLNLAGLGGQYTIKLNYNEDQI